MVCTSCGREGREGDRFCDQCGGPLAQACAQCGADLRPDAKFCGSCGAPVSGAAPAPAIVEARKTVTVLFADLIGSTALQERMDAESARSVMGRFYAEMSTVLDEHGGRVEKFIGDAVMAVFGAPIVREDDAERAVRAAGAMVAVLPALNAEIERQWGVRIGMRTGVNTGEVVESREGFVVGDPVNVAARLEQTAGDGEVLVGESTYRLVRDKLTLEAVEPLALKGKSEPVPAYRLVSLETPGAAESAAPFVGRDEELSRLVAAFERAVSDERARLATVVGSPGVGKTRLAHELASIVSQRALVLEARCEPAGSSTFAPIADALRDAASIDEAATDEDVVAALASLLPESQSDRDRIASRAATVLGAGEPGPPEETFWAVRRIFESLARERPVVFVVDDVHWAEPMLLDLIEHLADWTRDAPVFMLALARPDLRETRPSLAEAGGRDAVIVLLEGLDAEASVRLAHDLLDAEDLPPALTERILASSEGNPLFLRELVRMLVDDGVLRRDEGSWVVTVDADEVDVPPTIHALLSARIDRLRADERVVVERASVIGKQFYRGAVASLAPAPVASQLDGHLETLRRKELVEPEGTYWIDEPVFRFHHVLIRDAAYRRLLKEARAELHEQFAKWLEEKAGELVGEHEEVIGYHLEQAHLYLGELGTLDDHGRDLGTRAAAHLTAAGRRAIERDDLTAAAPLLMRALQRLESPDPEILIDLCEALLDLGDVVEAGPFVDSLSTCADTPRLQAWAECYAGQLANLIDPSRLHETASRVAAAAERFEELGDLAGAAKAHHVHAQTLGRLGQIGGSEAALDRALAAAREAGDARRSNGVLAGVPVAVLWGPSPVKKASGRCLDVIRVLRITTGSPAVEATALRCQAVLEAMRGRADAARKMLETSRSSLEELGLRHGIAENDVYAGVVELLDDEPAAAEGKLRGAYEELRRLGLDADAAYASALLARALLRQGRDQEAEELTRESERLGGDDLKTGILWRAVRGAALARRGEVDESLRLAREAVAMAEGTDALTDHADARRALGVALQEAGLEADAAAEFARAIALYEEKGATAAADRARRAGERGAGTVRSGAEPRVGRAHVAPGVDATHLRFVSDIRDAFLSKDWDGSFRSMLHPDLVVTDGRAGLQTGEVLRDAFVNGVGETYGDREIDWDGEIVASRGRTLLLRWASFGPGDEVGGPWESDRLTVFQLAPSEDLVLRAHFLDADAWDAARTVFREWSDASGAEQRVGGTSVAAGVDASHLPFFERVRVAVLNQDWDGMFAEVVHPDFAMTDERSGLRSGAVRRDAFAKGLNETYGGRPFDIEWEIVALRGRVAILRTVWFGPGDDVSGLWESERLWVTQLHPTEERLIRGHLVDPDAWDTAKAVFREWSASVGAEGRVGRVRAAPGVDATHQLFFDRMRLALAAHDFDGEFLSMTHPDLVVTDQRTALQTGAVDRMSFVVGARETYRGRTIDIDWEIVASRGRTAMSRFIVFGPGDDESGPWESDRIMVAQFAPSDDLLLRVDFLDADAWGAARALFEDWAGADDGVRAPAGADPEIVDFFVRFRAALVSKDWDGLTALWPDMHYIDRRRGLQSAEVIGGAEATRVVRESFGTREYDYPIEILTTRPDAAIIVGGFVGDGDELGGPFDATRVAVATFDANGLMNRGEIFDPDDRDAAFARLDELAPRIGTVRIASGVDATHVPLFERVRGAFAAQDWQMFKACYHADFVQTDDRRGLHTGDVELDAFVMGISELYTGRSADLDLEIVASRSRCVMFRATWFGSGDESSGPWESDRLMVVQLHPSEDLMLRSHFHDPDEWDAARALFDEWAGGEDGVRAPLLDGYVSSHGAITAPIGTDRRHIRLFELLRKGFETPDWEVVGSAFTDDVVYRDSRPGLRMVVTGRDEMTRVIRESYGTRPMVYDVEIVATRGDYGAARATIGGPESDLGGPWESERNYFYVLDGDLLASIELFDDFDLAHARLDEIDAKSAGLVVPPGTDKRYVRIWERIRDRLNAKDWATFATLFAPGLVGYDFRPGLRAEYHGPEEYVRAVRESYGTRDYEVHVEVLATGGDASVVITRGVGRGDEFGGPWETEATAFTVFDETDRLERIELYERDEADEVIARLRERDVERGGAARFIRVFDRMAAAFVSKDWDGFGAALREDVLYADRRVGLRVDIVGREQMVRAIRESFGTREECEASTDLIEYRGDVSMHVAHVGGAGDEAGGPWEAPRLVVSVLDADDKVASWELFDPDDPEPARERFHELVARAPARVEIDPRHVEFYARFEPAMNVGSEDALRPFLRDDIVFVDHRPGLRSEVVGREEICRTFEASYWAREFTFRTQIVESRGDAGVGRSSWSGPGDSLGGPWETERFFFYVLADDRLARIELFDLEDRDAALARIRAPLAALKIAPGVEYAWSHVTAGYIDAVRARDWDAVLARYAPSVRYRDHRSGLRVEVNDRQRVVEGIRAFADRGPFDAQMEVLASDRESRTLNRLVYTGSDVDGVGEWERPVLVISRNEEGSITEISMFADGDLLRALTEMNPSGAAIVRMVEAYNARDWDAVKAIFSPDVVVRDKRPMGWGNFRGADKLVARLLERVELAPDVTISVDACPIVTERAGLFRMPMSGHLADGGGEFEGNVLCLVELDGDVIVRLLVFEPDDLESVAARIDELTS